MSNYYRFKIIVLIIILIISSLLLSSCDKTKEKAVAKTKNEVVKNDQSDNTKDKSIMMDFGENLVYEHHPLERVISKISYIDHDKFFLKEGEKQPKEGIYANKTSDNKINWVNEDNNKDFVNTPKDIKTIEKLTLNGKKVKLPMKFSDFGKAYSSFDKVNFSKVTKKMYGNHIRSIDSDTKVALLGSSKVSLFNSKNEFLTDLIVSETGKIIKIGSTKGASYTNIPLLDIRFDGIGVGNTLNEMYEKLGKPSWHFASGRSISYFYKDGDNVYSLKISYKPEIYDNNSGRHITVRNNVITNVSIRLIKNYNSSHLGNGVEGNMANPVVKSADGELLYYKSGLYINYDYKAPYIDYGEFFIKEEEEQPTGGKYSDTTRDGKINWAKDERVIKKEPYNIQLILEKLTINDNKVHIPLKFSDLGKEYKNFEKVRLNELTEEMYPFIIKDAKSEVRISTGTEPLGSDFEKVVVLTKDKNHIASLRVNSKSDYISSIVPNTLHLSSLNIRLDGIGIGNTFNEMYDKLGSPSIIYNNKAVYRYSDGEFVCSIEFIHPVKLVDYRTKHLALVKKNTIGKVAITVSKNIDK